MPRKKAHTINRLKKPLSESEHGTIFFYMPNVKPYGVFCQCYPSSIEIPTTSLHFLTTDSPPSTSKLTSSHILASYAPTLTLTCAEQSYMFSKALYFHDTDMCRRILASSDAKEQKKLGQRIASCSQDHWDVVKSRICKVSNWYKFTDPRNKCMKDILLGTGKRDLAEAARRDRVWGIRYNEGEAESFRGLWGENLLGNAVMCARERIRGFEEGREEWDRIALGEWDGEVDKDV
ncbi:hypothetical protein CC86DRAFT_421778 [Ophiobolus disseminans]|uniref:NADAR domain-containing protein n=1 Tax=Ophiobolus disseminans TaxID=1469910 RepID=A0A6A6ZUL0_9PLEO|nr:hypothetical protein CC86DRAFT_421778 [Ophiobolus disseminans]